MGKGKGAGGNESWLQRLIASALMMGIGKRELMEDYYLSEISAVIEAWNELHRPDTGQEEDVGAMDFFGTGGEWVK